MEILLEAGRSQRFSKGENALLVHEVKKRQVRIFGSSATGPATRDDARQAWLEVAAAVSAFSGIQRHAEQVKKRYDTTKRSGIRKAAANGGEPLASGGGQATPAEVLAASTLFPDTYFAEYGIMGPAEAEGGEQWWKPLQEETDQEATAGEGGAKEETDPGPSAARQRPRRLRNNVVRPEEEEEEEEDHHPMLEIRRGLCSLKKARCGSGVAAPIKLNGAPGAFALKSRRLQRAKSTTRNHWAPAGRSQRFSEGEVKLLVHEVKARQARIYGSPTSGPAREDARRAWVEVAEAVSAFSGIQRHVYQIKKKFDTTKRMRKRKAAANRRERLASGGGQATPEVLAASTLFPESIYGIGGPAENGGAEGDERPLQVKSEETDRDGTGAEELAEEEEEADPDPGEGPSGVAAAEPGPSAARHRPPRGPLRNNVVTGPEEEYHHPIQEIQQAGFRMVQRELGALRRGLCSLNSRLVRQERLMAQGVTALQRSAAALERLAGLQGPPAAPPPMMMMAPPTRETAAPPAPPATASAGPE